MAGDGTHPANLLGGDPNYGEARDNFFIRSWY